MDARHGADHTEPVRVGRFGLVRATRLREALADLDSARAEWPLAELRIADLEKAIAERDATIDHYQRALALAERDHVSGVLLRGPWTARVLDIEARYSVAGGVAVLDIDDLKAVNDLYGHPAGDLVIRETGLRLKAAVDNRMVVGRGGGDEFYVWGERLDIDRIRAAVNQPLRDQAGNALEVGVSAGAVPPGSFEPLDVRTATADQEMYREKRRRKEVQAARQRGAAPIGQPQAPMMAEGGRGTYYSAAHRE